MLIPLLLDEVRIKDRPEVFLVFGLDLAKQTVDLLIPKSGLVEHGVCWSRLEDVWDDQEPAAQVQRLDPCREEC